MTADAPPDPPGPAPGKTAPPAPEDLPELGPALARFEAGDFREAHRLCDALLGLHPQGPVADAARVFKDRLSPDPWALRIGLFTLALLVWMVLAYAV